MKNNELEQLFEDLNSGFDIENPSENHNKKFLDKLNSKPEKRKTFNWRSVLAIAASVVICFSIALALPSKENTIDLANVSEELSVTQDFFTVAIENELEKINKERSPETETLIKDALKQIERLEKEYQKLKEDLATSDKDQRVIYAMVSNFQNRINILNTVLEHIEIIKNLKTKKNENTYSI